MSLALLENNTSSLSGEEIVLIESDDKMQLKDESSIKYDVDGKSNVEQHVVKKEIAEEKEREKRGNQSDYRAKGPAGGHYFFGWNEKCMSMPEHVFLSGSLQNG